MYDESWNAFFQHGKSSIASHVVALLDRIVRQHVSSYPMNRSRRAFVVFRVIVVDPRATLSLVLWIVSFPRTRLVGRSLNPIEVTFLVHSLAHPLSVFDESKRSGQRNHRSVCGTPLTRVHRHATTRMWDTHLGTLGDQMLAGTCVSKHRLPRPSLLDGHHTHRTVANLVSRQSHTMDLGLSTFLCVVGKDQSHTCSMDRTQSLETRRGWHGGCTRKHQGHCLPERNSDDGRNIGARLWSVVLCKSNSI